MEADTIRSASFADYEAYKDFTHNCSEILGSLQFWIKRKFNSKYSSLYNDEALKHLNALLQEIGTFQNSIYILGKNNMAHGAPEALKRATLDRLFTFLYLLTKNSNEISLEIEKVWYGVAAEQIRIQKSSVKTILKKVEFSDQHAMFREYEAKLESSTHNKFDNRPRYLVEEIVKYTKSNDFNPDFQVQICEMLIQYWNLSNFVHGNSLARSSDHVYKQDRQMNYEEKFIIHMKDIFFQNFTLAMFLSGEEIYKFETDLSDELREKFGKVMKVIYDL
jgi:hypothetical protein